MSAKPTCEELIKRVRELERGESGRKQIESELHRRIEELAVLNALAKRVNATLSFEETCNAAVQGVQEAVNPAVTFILLREGEALLLKAFAPGGRDDRLDGFLEHRVGECICGLAVRQGQAVFSKNIHTDKRCTWEDCKKAGFRSLAALPLRNSDNVFGVMGLAADTERDFEMQSGFLEMIAGQVSLAFHNARLYDRMQRELVEHKQTEEALRVKDRAMESALNGIAITDAEGKLIYANPAFVRLWGYASEAEVLGKTPLEFAERKRTLQILEHIQTRGTHVGELIARRRDGTTFEVMLSANAVRDAGGKIVNLMASFVDITEQKRAEEAMRRSEARFRELADMLPQIVFETDVNGNLTFANRNAFNTFGYTKDDFASDLNVMRMIAPTDRDRAADSIRRIMKGQSNLGGSEYRAVTKNGTEFPVIVYSTLFFCGERPTGLRGIMIDVTERKRAEEERERLQAQLIQAQKMESIGTLAGGIAHNFNNILMGIQGRASLMMMDKEPIDPDHEHLRGIQEYVKNAVELTRDLLGFARGGKYEIKTTDLNALIKNENRMFGHTKKEIQIHGRYEKDLWAVEVDQGQIRQALLNLYVNAWQAMPYGGELYVQTKNVTLDEQYMKPFVVVPGRYVKVSVTDTGVGMDAETQEKIFEPFFSTKDPGQGSGLGLASVYGIVKNHGGFVNVYSEKGKGATFNIYLPASESKAAEERRRPKRDKIRYGQGTVLLVDDEKMIIDVGKAILEKLGYRVLTAGSGQEALELYEKNSEKIDLVILDMIMPGMGGGETYDRLKKLDGKINVILSSGYSISGQATEILDRGCSGFIQKPFAVEELSRKVYASLVQRKSAVQPI